MQDFTKDELETIENLKVSADERLAFFERHRAELKLLTKFRMASQLKRRVDDSDVIQDAFVKYCTDLKQYLADPKIPPVAWLRRVVRQVIFRVNRTHVTTQCRDLRREESFGERSMVDLEELAASLSSVGKLIHRAELKESLHRMIAAMSPLEREILTLVHFESLTIKQAAQEIGISLDAAKKRYCRSLKRLRCLQEDKLTPYLS